MFYLNSWVKRMIMGLQLEDRRKVGLLPTSWTREHKGARQSQAARWEDRQSIKCDMWERRQGRQKRTCGFCGCILKNALQLLGKAFSGASVPKPPLTFESHLWPKRVERDSQSSSLENLLEADSPISNGQKGNVSMCQIEDMHIQFAPVSSEKLGVQLQAVFTLGSLCCCLGVALQRRPVSTLVPQKNKKEKLIGECS